MFTLFGTIAFFTVQQLLFSAIDDNLDKQATVDIAYNIMHPAEGSSSSSNSSVSSVFFAVFGKDGSVLQADRQIPFSDAIFTRALDGQVIKDFSTLSDGNRVRLL